MPNRMKVSVIIFFTLLALFQPQKAFSADFTDDSGRRITFDKPFRRIISLYPAHTENLFALGLQEEIAGVPSDDDPSPEAGGKPVFSYRDDPEKFLAAKPDLVLIRPMIYRGYRRLADRLEDAGIRVVSLQPNSADDMYEYWERLGLLTGRTDKARVMTEAFKKELAALQAKTADIPPEGRPGVFFESIHAKMKTFAPAAMPIFVLQSAGGVNAADDAESLRGTNIAEYGKERIISRSDRIDVYLAQEGTMNPVTVETIRNEPGFEALKAVRDGKVFLIDEKLVSRPTPRLLEGIRRIGRILYPERFKD